jgi:hypothetical protein
MVGLFALVFGVGVVSYVAKGTFMPWAEEIRRETFEQSTSFVQGKITQLSRYRLDYTTADSTQQCALRFAALHEATTMDRTTVPEHLAIWITNLEEDTTCAAS